MRRAHRGLLASILLVGWAGLSAAQAPADQHPKIDPDQGWQTLFNGAKIIDADLDDWTEANQNPDGTPNKYHKPMRDLRRTGHILLQDHPGSIWFRNVP